MASTTITAPSHPHGSSFPSSQGPVDPPQAHAHPARRPLPGCESAAATAAASRVSFDHTSQKPLIQSSQIHQYHSQSQPQSSSQQSLKMSQHSSQPGNYAPSSSFRQFADSGPVTNNHSTSSSQIYSATYSGVEVYEMEINGVAVMRRRNDSSLNATQILKVANIDKGKRTKILEKEIQTGQHEKVQGGYGKYQGTWIPHERARQVCRQYGVEEALEPLLTYDMGQDGGVAGRGDINTPTKEQAMAAQRKRNYMPNPSVDARSNSQNGGLFFSSISPMASTAVAAISKAKMDSPGPRHRNGPSRGTSFNRQSSMQNADDFLPNSQQSVDSAYSTQSNAQKRSAEDTVSPRKRQRLHITPASSFGHAQAHMQMNADNFPGSPTEPNESFIYSQAGINAHEPLNDGLTPLPPLPFENSVEAENKRSMLMDLFMGSDTNDTSKHAILQTMTPMELDMPIDAPHCHTALHWAAALSRIPLVKALLEAGASPYRVNTKGETPLARACAVTNSHDFNTFPDLLDLLGNTLEVVDPSGRTVLHHIAITSAIQGRHAASKYYLESLLEWIVRQGGNSQDRGVNGNDGYSSSPPNRLDLARFMSEIVDAQDYKGDTALNIAARLGNRSIAHQLKEVGAKAYIVNNNALKASDFLNDLDTAEPVPNGEVGRMDEDRIVSTSQRTKESSDDIVSSITHLLEETSTVGQEEMKKKQQSIDALLMSLRSLSMQAKDAKLELMAIKEKKNKQQLNMRKIKNLTEACADEQEDLSQLEQQTASMDNEAAMRWEAEVDRAVTDPRSTLEQRQAILPPVNVLRARIAAMRSVSMNIKGSVDDLKSRSTEFESKYRHLVAIATGCPEDRVDAELVGLTRAVESERGELDIGRVRRFLGGVESAT